MPLGDVQGEFSNLSPNGSASAQLLANLRIDPSTLPTMRQATGNLLLRGLQTGGNELLSQLGSAAEAAGVATGFDSLQQVGARIAADRARAAQATDRLDLEKPILELKGSEALPFLGFQLAKQVPSLAALLAGTVLAPQAAVPAGLARLGAALPRVLGGGAGLAEAAAAKTGQEFAREVTGATIAGFPLGVGQLFDAAKQKEGGASQGDALASIAGGVPFAAVGGLLPTSLRELGMKGSAGTLARRVLTGAATTGAIAGPQTAVQTALTQQFGPPKSFEDKSYEIVNAALTGAVTAAALGGVVGLRRLKNVKPVDIDNASLGAAVDSVVLPQAPPEADSQLNLPGVEGAPQVPGAGAASLVRPAVPELTQVAPVQGEFNAEALKPNQFTRHTNDQLGDILARVEGRLAKGSQDPADDNLRTRLQAELARRVGAAPSEAAPLGGLLTEEQVAQPAVGPRSADFAQAQTQIKAMQDFAAATAGRATQFTKSLQARDETGVAAAVYDNLLQGGRGKTLEKLGRRFGLVDDTGALRTPATLQDERLAIQKQLVAADGDPIATRDATARLDALDAQARLFEQIRARGVGVGGDELAPQDPAPALNAQPALDLTFASPTAAETPATTAQFVKDAAGPRARVNAPVRSRAELTAFVIDQLATKRPSQTVRELGAMLGLADETGTPVKLAEARARADAELQQIKVAHAADGQAETAAMVRNAQDKVDILSATQEHLVRRETAAQAVAEAQRAAEVKAQERSAARAKVSEVLREPHDALEALRDSDAVPAELKERAAAAQSLLETNAPKAQQTASRVLKDYADTLRNRVTRPIDPQAAPRPDETLARGTKEDAAIRARVDAILGRNIPASEPAPNADAILGRNIPDASETQRLSALQAKQAQEEAQALSRRDQQIARATEINRARGGATIQAATQPETTPKPLSAAEFAARHNSKFNVSAPAARQSAPLSESAFQRAFERATRKLGPVRDAVTVVDTVQDLPSGVLQDAARNKLDVGGIHGAIKDGQVYVVKSNVRSPADLQNTVFHEVLGHGGAIAQFGGGRDAVMARLFDKAGGLDGLQATARKLGAETDVQRYLPPDGVQLTDVHKAALADELLAQVAGQATGKFKTTLLEFAGRVQRAVVGFLNAHGMEALARRFDKLGPAELAAMLGDMRQAVLRGGPLDARETAFKIASIPDTDAAMSKVVGLAKQGLAELDSRATLPAALRRASLGWRSLFDLTTRYRKEFPQLELYEQAQQDRNGRSARLAQLFNDPYLQVERLLTTDPKAAELTGKLMMMSEFGIDYRKTWEQHTHLHDDPNAGQLKQKLDEAHEIRRQLSQRQQTGAYDDLLAANEALHLANMAVKLHNLVGTDAEYAASVKGFGVDPVDGYLARAQESPQDGRAYWQGVVDAQLKNVQEYIDAQRGVASTDARQAAGVVQRLTPLEAQVASMREALTAQQQAPYFHLGREGEFFVAFDIAKLADGTKDKAAAARAVDVLGKAGFGEAQITPESTKANVYIRLKNPTQMNNLYKLALDLQKQGLLDKGTDVLRGPRSDEDAVKHFSPEWLNRLIEKVEADEAFKPTDGMSPEQRAQMIVNKEQVIANLRSLALDLLPDLSLSKVTAQRNAVPGFSKDMFQSFAQRTRIGVNALANLSSAPKTLAAMTEMRAALNAAKGDSAKDPVLLRDLFAEVSRREAERPYQVKNDFIDTWRAATHAFFLGASPAYSLINISQLGVLLWPQFAKTHGFVESAKAIARVTPTAFRIMRATFAEGAKLGPVRAADAVITRKALVASGESAADAEFVMGVVNRGHIDVGSASRELGRAATGVDSKTDLALRYASSLGHYSETFTRLVAALAAHELHGDRPGLDRFVDKTLNEAMLNYSTGNRARQTGKLGLAGPLSPVMFQFHTYQLQVLEKMYREVATAFFDRATTPDERSQARRFLGAHLLATTAIAGSLGMPFASVAATAMDKLRDLLGGDNSDTTADWRNLLADMFGKDVGEIAARGLPRALGVDVSQRAGEQDLLPFSRLLTDRRKLEDAVKDYALQSLGSPVSMVANALVGARDVLDGKVLEGVKGFVPLAIKGPIEAYRMSEDGYVDRAGNKLPMTPGGAAILAQALGFTPAAKAEHSEAKRDQTARRQDIARTSQNIRNQLATAIENQRQGDIKKLMQEARDFDARHPLNAILPRVGATLARRAQERAQARATQTPLGTNIRDQRARELTGFANF